MPFGLFYFSLHLLLMKLQLMLKQLQRMLLKLLQGSGIQVQTRDSATADRWAIHTPFIARSVFVPTHILPGKGDGPKPVIARFYSRYWRNLVFRNRKEFSPRETSNANAAPSTSTRSNHVRTPRMRFPFFEDLTKATFTKLSDIKQQEGVISAWTVNGSIRFKLKDNNTIFRVSKLQETLKEIIG